ncbi:hypothetical protein IVB41_25220 [Bradyrhizobium sp. 44]|jgi:hypothetical protein|nr:MULTISPECIES: hypothetical protein [unclassified Bradyrhizobium]MCK1287215.1 hypothetical protein [Bradyrhizobium sp. 44]
MVLLQIAPTSCCPSCLAVVVVEASEGRLVVEVILCGVVVPAWVVVLPVG